MLSRRGSAPEQEYDRARALFEQSLKLSTAVGAIDVWWSARLPLAFTLEDCGETAQAAALYEEVVASVQVTQDRRSLFFALLGVSMFDLRRAMELCEQELAHADLAGDAEARAITQHIYGRLLLDAGDAPRATFMLQRALAFWREQGVTWSTSGGSARVLYDLGRAAWLQEELDLAMQQYAESLRGFRAIDDNVWTALILIQYGYVALDRQDLDHATACFREGLELWQVTQERDDWPLALAGLAEVAYHQGNVPLAAQMYGAAARRGDTLRGTLLSERVGYERLMAAARLRLDNPAFAAAWAEGEMLTTEQAVALALSTD